MSYNSVALFNHLCEDLKPYLDTSKVPSYPTGDIISVFAGASLETVRARHLVNSFLKKNQDQVLPDADSKAISLFLSSNKECEEWEDRRNTSFDDVLIGEFKRLVYEFWNPNGLPLVSSFDEIWEVGRMGPGSGLEATGFDFYSKLFSSSLTCTSLGLYTSYKRFISRFPTWALAESQRVSHYKEATVKRESRVCTVPKRRDISRTICVEPTLNMFAQLGLGSKLEDRIRTFFGFDLSDQQVVNRDLACKGSLYDLYSTIDLKSASDTISLKMLRSCLPRDFYDLLCRLRTPYANLPNRETVELHMVSTMGNGFTFPLQTMLFSCAVSAASRALGLSLKRRTQNYHGDFGVFGDDIIVPTHFHYRNDGTKSADHYGLDLYRAVCRLLSLLGFHVNADKSFFEGSFRESCGGDYYQGANVRGVYIKTLKTEASRYVAHNRLRKWSEEMKIPLPRTLAFLRGFVRYLPVPLWEADDAGLQLTLSQMLKVPKRAKHEQSLLYFKRIGVPLYLRIDDGSIAGKAKQIFNYEGLLISFLSGHVRNYKIGVRPGHLYYRTVKAIAPHWE
jgi:hypothetical protein